MKKEIFSLRSEIPVCAEELFRWHARPGALERLTPPWEVTKVISRIGNGIEVGAQVVINIKNGPLTHRLVAEHTLYEEGRRFRDVMIEGPFSFWQHTHTIEPNREDTSFLEDQIEYALPLGALGRVFGGSMVREKLRRAFAYRHRLTIDDLSEHWRYQLPPLRIAVTGSRGVIGSALLPFLTTGGHSVVPLVRGKVPTFGQEIAWDPAAGLLPLEDLEGFDAVIHLAGEPVGDKRWTKEQKAKIKASRVEGTRLLAESLAKLQRPPRVFLSASAVGFYGDRKDEALTEDSSAGQGFLAEVCQEWEAATEAAQSKGIRVVHLRIGAVLTPSGGALQQMLTPFLMGVGGKLGPGSQSMSWIVIDDVLGILLRALADPSISGPLNVTAPNPETNEAFTKTLASVLSRPSFMSVPKLALRLAYGEVADEALFASARVIPQKLLGLGHTFRFPRVEGALRYILGK